MKIVNFLRENTVIVADKVNGIYIEEDYVVINLNYETYLFKKYKLNEVVSAFLTINDLEENYLEVM